jgi:hypothetical protein
MHPIFCKILGIILPFMAKVPKWYYVVSPLSFPMHAVCLAYFILYVNTITIFSLVLVTIDRVWISE